MSSKYLLFLMLALMVLMLGCKAETIKKGMQNADIEYTDISHIHQTNNGAAVFYRAKTDIPNQFPLGLAFFKGSQEEEWEYIISSWSHYENENLIISEDAVPGNILSSKPDGNSIHIKYGEIRNPYINKVLVRDRKTGEWIDAEIVRENDFIFYKIGNFDGVKALSSEGNVIDIQGIGNQVSRELGERKEIAHEYLHEKVMDGYEGDHYYLGTSDSYQMNKDKLKLNSREFIWKLVNVSPEQFEGHDIYVEKFKIDLNSLEQKHKGSAFFNLLITSDTVISGYITIESENKLFFDLSGNELKN
jgi:hypothetical protein